jgi:hypothetical protein
MDRVQSALTFDRGYCHPIEHDQAFLAILDVLTRNDENRRIEHQHLPLILLFKSADFLFPKARVHFA